jgi:YD repeat-containing protein
VQKQIGQPTYTTQTAYDPLGHITSITYPQNGGVVNYAYDGAFNIVSVSDPASGTVYAAFSGYNALGQPGQIVFANGKDSTTTYTYYPLNHRLQKMTTNPPAPAKSVQDMAYTYDSDGNVTAVTDNVVPNNSQQFTYDGLNRLTIATSPSYSTITFTHDAIGNITLNTRVGSYTYGAHPHAVTQAGTLAHVRNQSGAYLRLRQPRFELNGRSGHHLVCV